MDASRDSIVLIFRKKRSVIRRRFDTRRLAIFGSAARDELRADSDIDVLVEFNGPATYDAFMDLKAFLEEVLGRSVDLVTAGAVKPRLAPYIERDLIDVA